MNGHGREICCPRVAMGRGRLRTFIAILELRLSRGWTGWHHGDEGLARGSSGADPRRGRASASRRLRASRARLKRFRALQRETHPVDERHRVAPILRHEVTSAAEASEHRARPRNRSSRAEAPGKCREGTARSARKSSLGAGRAVISRATCANRLFLPSHSCLRSGHNRGGGS